jgi:hypothetical protein
VDPAKLAEGNGPFGVATAREVHRHGLLAQAATTGRDVQADAGDLACHLPGQLQSADDRLRTLLAARQGRTPARARRTCDHHATPARPTGQPRRPGREAVL